MLWLYPALVKTSCTLNVKYFPFDSQQCKIVFISWTHSGYELDVIFNETSMPNSVYYTGDHRPRRSSIISSDPSSSRFSSVQFCMRSETQGSRRS